MSILQQLTDDMKSALRAGEKDRLQVIRMVLSDVKNIDLQPNKPTELQAVEGYYKKLRKSLEEYEKLGKSNEINALKFEMSVVEKYLPKKLSADETAALIDTFLTQNPYTEKQSGQATGIFMKTYGTQVDSGTAAKLIREKLAGK